MPGAAGRIGSHCVCHRHTVGSTMAQVCRCECRIPTVALVSSKPPSPFPQPAPLSNFHNPVSHPPQNTYLHTQQRKREGGRVCTRLIKQTQPQPASSVGVGAPGQAVPKVPPFPLCLQLCPLPRTAAAPYQADNYAPRDKLKGRGGWGQDAQPGPARRQARRTDTQKTDKQVATEQTTQTH